MSTTVRAVTHIHTKHSWDGLISPSKLVDWLEEHSIGLALVTDHDTFEGSRAVARLVADRGFDIVVPVAAEVRTDEGDVVVVLPTDVEGMDIGVFKTWDSLVSTVRRVGGLVWLPHPYRSHTRPEALAEYADVIEVYNGRCSEEQDLRAEAIQLASSAHAGMGSDAHLVRELGDVVVEYNWLGNHIDTLRQDPSALRLARTVRANKSLAEFVGGWRRRRFRVMAYFGARFIWDSFKGWFS